MKTLRNRICAVGVVGVTTLMAPMLVTGVARADPISDQKARVELITTQLEALERQADVLAEDYVTAVDELNQLEAEVTDAEAAVAAKQADVDKLQGDLGQVALQAFMGGGGGNVLGPLLGDSTEFNQEMQRDELTRVALNTGTADSDALSRALSELADERQALQEQRDAAEEKKREVHDAQVATDAKSEEYTQARADAEAELGDLIRQEEERRARESYQRMQAEAAAAQAQAQAAAQAQAQSQQQTQSAAPAVAGNNTSSANNTSSGNNSSSGGAPAPARTPAPARPVAPTNPVVPAASSRGGTAVAAALTQLGVAWVFAAATPGVAFDCSGLTMWAWGRAGVSLPHQSRQQYAMMPHVPASAAQPGDLLFFYSPISHVGIYMGGGRMVHSPNAASSVNVRAVNWGNVVGVGRPG